MNLKIVSICFLITTSLFVFCVEKKETRKVEFTQSAIINKEVEDSLCIITNDETTNIEEYCFFPNPNKYFSEGLDMAKLLVDNDYRVYVKLKTDNVGKILKVEILINPTNKVLQNAIRTFYLDNMKMKIMYKNNAIKKEVEEFAFPLNLRN